MKLFTTILFILSLFASLPVYASYFPDPTPTTEWDLIGGQISGGVFGLGSEVAAWDAGGTLRFRATIDTLANYYGLAAFYGPPTGSTDPHDFTWKVFDGMNVYLATVHDDGTTWANYVGNKDSFMLNLDRGEQQACVPEPATIVILSMIAGSGMLVGARRKKRK